MRGSRIWTMLASESGFTLIELLAVALIVIILALMALPVYAEVSDKARVARSQELSEIAGALDAFYANEGTYPDRLGELVKTGYLKPTGFYSSWNKKVFYYYALWHVDGKLTYIVGEPGPEANCQANPSPCGSDPYDEGTTVGVVQSVPDLPFSRSGR